MERLLLNGDLEAARSGDRSALDRVLGLSRQNLRRHAEFRSVINNAEHAVKARPHRARVLAHGHPSS